jgi:hypothetical protein
MKNAEDTYSELKEISPFLAGVERRNVFSVPEGYFSMLSLRLLEKSKENSLTSLPASEPVFSDVPEGYFESLPEIILKKIKSPELINASDELGELSPVLYAIQSENVFLVPRGYFQNFPDQITRIVNPARVVPIKKRNSVWNYAVAAVLSGVMAVSALWISNKSQQNTLTANNTLPAYIKEAGQYKNEQQINEAISKLADDDIIKYLETTGNTADEELLTTIVKTNDLPSEEDYLVNEKALESFLSKSSQKNNEN